MAWKLTPMQRMEQALLTELRKPIWRPFMRADRKSVG